MEVEREHVALCAGPSREEATAGYKAGPVNLPFRRQFSIGDDIFVIGHRILVKRFAGIGFLGARWGQAGWRVVPGPEVAKDIAFVHPSA